MNVKELIEEVENDAELVSYLNLVPKKNKKTQMDTMHVLNRLSYILYLSDNTALAQSMIDKMVQVDFDGDYRYWEPVQNTALLAILIDEEKYLTQVRDRILYALNYGDEVSVFGKRKVHKRFLTGFRLNSLQTELEKAKDEVSQMNKRMGILFHLLYLKAFSNELEIDRDLVNNEIQSTILILRDYILINGFKQLYPFK
ncbi:DUF6707 family protein [Streptococcus oralis]|uniref:DUF6707 family protein n=1 Tax=Streptococcus oralis TaxID=1303 RepID=UPI00232BF27E|nr:DUF6707 family protein [Streptococcus oralis]MDB6209489.1 hypothetical protein [Streptococcus oralis]